MVIYSKFQGRLCIKRLYNSPPWLIYADLYNKRCCDCALWLSKPDIYVNVISGLVWLAFHFGRLTFHHLFVQVFHYHKKCTSTTFSGCQSAPQKRSHYDFVINNNTYYEFFINNLFCRWTFSPLTKESMLAVS